MKFVAAKKEPAPVILGTLNSGGGFRFPDRDGIHIRVCMHGSNEFYIYNVKESLVDVYHQSVQVIPARVLLVEKGADIEEVKRALEEL